MKTATYTGMDGKPFQVEYDENAPCKICNLPVTEASVGGTDICPWCDSGYHRDGRRLTFRELVASVRTGENLKIERRNANYRRRIEESD